MSTFSVSPQCLHPCPAEEIYPYVIGFREWLKWSPRECIDPSMQRSCSGPVEGVGAGCSWRGDGKAGAGTMQGENKGLGRVFALIGNMDKLAGADFGKGLAQLAAVVAAGR